MVVSSLLKQRESTGGSVVESLDLEYHNLNPQRVCILICFNGVE